MDLESRFSIIFAGRRDSMSTEEIARHVQMTPNQLIEFEEYLKPWVQMNQNRRKNLPSDFTRKRETTFPEKQRRIQELLETREFVRTKDVANHLGISHGYAGQLLQAVTRETIEKRQEKFLLQNSNKSVYELAAALDLDPLTVDLKIRGYGKVPNREYHVLSSSEVRELKRNLPQYSSFINAVTRGKPLPYLVRLLGTSSRAAYNKLISLGLLQTWEYRKSTDNDSIK